MILEDVPLSGINRAQDTVRFRLHVVPGSPIYRDRELNRGCQGPGRRGRGVAVSRGTAFQFGEMGRGVDMAVVTVTQQRGHKSRHRAAHIRTRKMGTLEHSRGAGALYTGSAAVENSTEGPRKIKARITV